MTVPPVATRLESVVATSLRSAEAKLLVAGAEFVALVTGPAFDGGAVGGTTAPWKSTSQASPIPSRSASDCELFATAEQLSLSFGMPSLSKSAEAAAATASASVTSGAGSTVDRGAP